MTESKKTKRFDLEDRTFAFARDARAFIKKVSKTVSNFEDCKQLTRSSGSVGANYIEANEALGKKDFIMRVKISRKEVKESRFWLGLIDVSGNSDLERTKRVLAEEATELMMIFGSIIRKSE